MALVRRLGLPAGRLSSLMAPVATKPITVIANHAAINNNYQVQQIMFRIHLERRKIYENLTKNTQSVHPLFFSFKSFHPSWTIFWLSGCSCEEGSSWLSSPMIASSRYYLSKVAQRSSLLQGCQSTQSLSGFLQHTKEVWYYTVSLTKYNNNSLVLSNTKYSFSCT